MSLTVVDCLFPIESRSPQTISTQELCEISEPQLIRDMDRTGISCALISPCRRWRCERHWLCAQVAIDDLVHRLHSAPGRFAGLAFYSPFAIADSLEALEKAIGEHGFCGAFVLTEASDIPVMDARMYPLYARCAQLRVPVVVQVSNSVPHTAVPKDLALLASDFPELSIVAGVLGKVHIADMLRLCERYTNLSFAFDGCFAEPFEVALFRNSEVARERAMFGSNGIEWSALIQEIGRNELPYDFARAFLHDNANRVFALDAHRATLAASGL